MMDHHNSLKLKKKNFILFWPQHVAAATTKTPEKLPFPLMNNNNSLKLKTSDPRQPQLTRGHLTAPQTAAPSPCATSMASASAATSVASASASTTTKIALMLCFKLPFPLMDHLKLMILKFHVARAQ